MSYESDMTYLEKIERQAAIARADEAARLLSGAYLMGRAAVRAVARLVKPANDDEPGKRAA